MKVRERIVVQSLLYLVNCETAQVVVGEPNSDAVMALVYFRHLALADICHIVGTLHLCTYWLLVHFPTVSKCDTSRKNPHLLLAYKVKACCCIPKIGFIHDK